jgi:anti-sigma factor RsiW
MAATSRTWSDGEVRAFVDGLLDAAAASQLAQQVQKDLALAERVARQRALKRRAAAAPDAPAEESLPPQEGSETVPPAPPVQAPPAAPLLSQGAPGATWWMGTALVAVLAVMLGWKLPRAVGDPVIPHTDGLAANGVLAEALATRVAAEGSIADGVRVSLSFRANDGRYCRTFSLASGIDGLACRGRDAWIVEATGRSPAYMPSEDGLRQPPAELSPAVLAAISRWQAGNALTPEQERRVIEAGWR